MFHRTDFARFLVCCYKAIQQLNGVEKDSVAISLMLNHNLTGLSLQLRRTCLSAIPLDHDDLLRFPGQKVDIFLRAQVQIYITKELKCVFM